MALRKPCPSLLILLILLATSLTQLSEGASYQQFKTQHINFPKTKVRNNQRYCDILMQRRGLSDIFCKHRNTFIHAPARQLRAICRRGGTHIRFNLYDSKKPFPVTTCRLLTGSRPGRCRYRATVGDTMVRVACVRRRPVSLEPTYLP